MNNIGHFVPSSFRKCIYLNTCYSYAHFIVFIVYFVSTRCVPKVIRHFQETQVSVQQITGHFVDVKIKHLLVLKTAWHADERYKSDRNKCITM